jgi:hypothetical protein
LFFSLRIKELAMKSKLLRITILMLPVISLILLSSPVFALGIGVTPGKLNFNVSPGTTEVQTINIINQSDADARFQVYMNDDLKEWFEILPGDFVLTARKVQNVEIKVSPPLLAKQNLHNTTIYIISTPPESDLKLGAGIKVATNVQITSSPIFRIEMWVIVAGVILALILGALLWRKYRNRYDY